MLRPDRDGMGHQLAVRGGVALDVGAFVVHDEHPRPRPATVRDGRHDPVVIEPGRPVVAGHEPAGEIRVDPVADGPVEVRRDEPGWSRAIGRAEEDARADVVDRVRVEEALGGDPAAVRRPCRLRAPSRPERAPRAARYPASSTSTRPDRRPRVEIGFRAAVAGEGDRPAVGVPGDLRDTPVAARHLPWPAVGHVEDEQMRPSVAMPLLVPAPVRPGDVPGHGRLGIRSLRRTSARDGPGPAADEPGRVDLGGEGQSHTVRRPCDLADRAMAPDSGHMHPVRSSDVEDADRGDRVVVGRVASDEGERVAVGAETRFGIADRAAGQLTRGRDVAAGREVDREQVAEVAVAPDRAPDDHRGPAIDGQVELLDHDHAPDVLGCHRASTGHARQPSRAARLRVWPSRCPSPIDSSSRPRWPRPSRKGARSSRSNRR